MTMARSATRGPVAGAVRGRPAAGPGLALRTLRFLARHPLPVLATVAALGLTGAFAHNVLLRQSAKHPAPLFARETAPVAPAAAPAALPPPRLEPAAAPLPVPRPDRTGSLAPAIEPARAAPGSDAIGALIRAGDGPARPGEAAKPMEPARIASAQRALTKLGYGPLKADGLFGSSTRAALERFERDRSLPVTGQVAGRTARQLASLSGIALD
ncbi:MAG: peptidoglycan-binding protein [Methylobacteriaceae bacterium]|nr:peptidoglycan-binding protein [Methylobacteriaceae bacterium]